MKTYITLALSGGRLRCEMVKSELDVGMTLTFGYLGEREFMCYEFYRQLLDGKLVCWHEN